MGTVIGYARVSTVDQNLQLQHDALQDAGAIRVFSDHASGSQADRPQLAACLDFLRVGDTLVVWRLDRLGRSLSHLVQVVEELRGPGIEFRSLTEGFDTSTSGGRLVFHVFAAVAEFERNLTRERTMAGLEAARRQGRTGGRPTVMTQQRLDAARLLRQDGHTLQSIGDALGVSPSTVGRHLATVASTPTTTRP